MRSVCIAFYMHDLSGGGVERMRLALIAELRARDLQVLLVLDKKSGALAPMLPNGLPVMTLGACGLVGAVWQMVRFLRSSRPDVLVSSLDHNNVVAMLARTIACVRTRVVICQHNALSAEQALGWRYRAVPWLYWLLQRGASGIVAVSEGVANDLASTAGIKRSRITPIYNPVIGVDFPARAKGEAPHAWLVNLTIPVFVFAGRLTAQKDPLLMLDAMAQLLKDSVARLILLGEGPLLAELQTRTRTLGIADSVEFVGFQANPLPWLRHATALVSTSRYEGLGNAIVEALACGTPVIATDCPYGPSEILLGGEIGRLVAVGDAAALAASMRSQIDLVSSNEALLRRADAFTAEACADAHLALFDRLLHRRHIQALGMHISPLSAGEVLDSIMSDNATGGVRLVVTPNIDHVRLLRQPDFAAAYRSAHYVCPDGLPVLLYAWICGLRLPARVTGCELFRRLARHSELASQKLFLVVESADTAAAVSAWSDSVGLSSNVQMAVAPRNLAGEPSAQASLAQTIREAHPTILVMTLGAPLSEVFVHRHRNTLPSCWALCVGQAVRVELGLTARAPLSWRRLGLEWLWRVRQEPRRLSGRYARAFAWFPIAVARDIFARPRMTR